jgi:hypothetical protein
VEVGRERILSTDRVPAGNRERGFSVRTADNPAAGNEGGAMPYRQILVGTTVLLALAAGAASAGTGALPLGPSSVSKARDFKGYYDGHKDTFLVTDVSNKAQAAALHVNYSQEIGRVKGAPAQYFIRGRAARGQLSVFGSEPGESDYNPLWEEFFVTWNSGVKPVLLVKDDQIKALAKSKKLTLKDAHVVLNAPITKVTR